MVPPPTGEQLQQIVDKKVRLKDLADILGDYVKEDDQDSLFTFLLAANISIEQLRAIVHGKYEVKKTQKPDGGYSLSINFDLSGVNPHWLDGKLPDNLMDVILNPTEVSGNERKKRILSGLLPDDVIDILLIDIGAGKLKTRSDLDSILNGHYKIVSKPTKSLHITQSLGVNNDPTTIDDQQIMAMMKGELTVNQLVKVLGEKFNPLEIKAIFDSGLTVAQLRNVIQGNYEVNRKKLDDGSDGYIIDLVYSKDAYKSYLQSILNGKYPVEAVLKLFKGRLGPEELDAILKLGLTVPDLHALLIGDYVIKRVDNPDGSYSLDIVYNKGAGNVKDIEEIGNESSTPVQPTKPDSRTVEPQSTTKPEISSSSKANVAEPGAKEIVKKPSKSKADTAKTAKKEDESPLVPAGEVKRRMQEAQEAIQSVGKPAPTAESTEHIQKVQVPDFTQDKSWGIEKGNKLKIPAMFKNDAKPNFFKKDVKHLQSDKVKSFYETKAQKRK